MKEMFNPLMTLAYSLRPIRIRRALTTIHTGRCNKRRLLLRIHVFRIRLMERTRVSHIFETQFPRQLGNLYCMPFTLRGANVPSYQRSLFMGEDPVSYHGHPQVAMHSSTAIMSSGGSGQSSGVTLVSSTFVSDAATLSSETDVASGPSSTIRSVFSFPLCSCDI